MTKFRNPVPDAPMKRPLVCVDFDGSGKNLCKNQLADHPNGSGNFKCPNHGTAEGKCLSGAFLYPRGKRDDGSIHFHQGIDLTPTPRRTAETDESVPRATIYSVTSGRVTHADDDPGGSYGKVVVIEYDDGKDPSTGEDRALYFLYAHCHELLVAFGDVVTERQPIAIVGRTGISTPSIPDHLHFEVSERKLPLPSGPAHQTKLGQGPGDRLDPLEVLASLGPWGAQQLFDPQRREINAKHVTDLHAEVEVSQHGGHFPLGSNNLWHGGVHLRMERGSLVHAPIDGTIVAARLHPEPKVANKVYGSTNFILLRHEVPLSVSDEWRGNSGTSSPKTNQPDAIGEGQSNPEPQVVAAKRALHAQGHYAPENTDDIEDGTLIDEPFLTAIRAFQATLRSPYKSPSKPWPDGVMTIGGYTWNALSPKPTPSEDPDSPASPTTTTTDPKRTLYSLFMHLDAVPIASGLVEKVPWLGRVRIAEPDPPPKSGSDDENDDPKTEEHDPHRPLSAPVGHSDSPHAPGLSDDVAWVQRRLQVHTGYTCSDEELGTFSDALDQAIREFQAAHVAWFKKKGKAPDGVVEPGKGTYTALSRAAGRADDVEKPKSPEPEVDPKFVELVEQRDEHRLAKVVSGLSVRVQAGEPLWPSGLGIGLGERGRTFELPQIHWEIFSQEQLIADWADAAIDDTTNDLSLDVPNRIYEAVEVHDAPGFDPDQLLEPLELYEFYRSERSTFLRRTPCRFLSEWGLDIPAAVGRIEEMGMATDGLTEALRPYMWWDQATDVLPESRYVWHYNPIELVGHYQETLELLRWRALPRDPSLFGDLVVEVFNRNGGRIAVAVVIVLGAGGEIVASKTTAKLVDGGMAGGEAAFDGLIGGAYQVLVQSSEAPPRDVQVPAGQVTRIELHTDIDGPGLARGRVRVIVRTQGWGRAENVQVELSRQDGEVVGVLTTKTEPRALRGEAHFEDVPYGHYVAKVLVEGEPTSSVKLNRASRVVNVFLPAPTGKLWVELSTDEGFVSGEEVRIEKDGATVATERTDAYGLAWFELPEGRYRVRAAKRRRSVRVPADAMTGVELRLKQVDDGIDEGVLMVEVHDEDGEPMVDEVVVLLDAHGNLLDSKRTNEDGFATFACDVGYYTVAAGDQSQEVAVEASATSAVTLRLE